MAGCSLFKGTWSALGCLCAGNPLSFPYRDMQSFGEFHPSTSVCRFTIRSSAIQVAKTVASADLGGGKTGRVL